MILYSGLLFWATL